MPEREIKTALGTYVNEHGVSGYGFKGDKVQVHKDHVDRFDELNVDLGDEAVSPRTAVNLVTGANSPGPFNQEPLAPASEVELEPQPQDSDAEPPEGLEPRKRGRPSKQER